MPWAIFNRPSIQLASLGSYIEKKSSYSVETFHPYLDIARCIGPELYSEIALSGWSGEAIFSALLYPEKKQDAEKLFFEGISRATKSKVDFSPIVEQVRKVCDTWLSKRAGKQYNLIGFSICFSQLLPSLYMAKLIKQQQPNLPVVFGGSSCSGEVGRSLLDQFAQIDYIIDGEGEERLLALCHNISEGESNNVEGLLSRQSPPEEVRPIPPLEMDSLPLPDYTSYFSQMATTFSASPFIPVIPVEFSRGCWWNKCTFCNLNIQWPSYRYKTGKRMVSEVAQLSRQYQCLHFTFTDNALPPRDADYFFEQTAEAPVDLDFFAEIRGTSDTNRLKRYRKGGLTTIQVGIEALSTSLLKKMKKGRSAMDNIAMMKLCAEQGIRLEGNIIVNFPTSTPEEIEQTLANLQYVMPFAPLEPATFFLGYGSPIYNNIADYSIASITPHTKTRQLFPKDCYNSMTSLISGYRGDKGLQTKLWQPVRKALSYWKEFHQKRANKEVPALSYRDGGDFLIIRQENKTTATNHHRVKGLSRKIYLSAHVPITIQALEQQFPQVKPAALKKFIDEMCSKRLMFVENNLVLSLAIRDN